MDHSLNFFIGFMTKAAALVVGGVLTSILFYSQSYLITFQLYELGNLSISLDFSADTESVLFCLSLLVIVLAVVTYTDSYLAGEKWFNRFSVILLLFVLAMIVLVMSANLYAVMVGWDGLGVTSFLLVVFFQNKNSTNAGLLTIFTNRLGDVLIVGAMSLMLSSNSLSVLGGSVSGRVLPEVLSVMIVLAAFTKSAQIPFSSWLPAAMAAPTPVSSLVHSSTLVTAGVYLLFRFKDTLSFASDLSPVMLLMVGSLTMVMAGCAGMCEDDLKKMVALSTLSQLGLMMSCLGLCAPQLAFFHLLSHAYFKALLFMTTGSMIHSLGGYQDLRVVSLPVSGSLKTGSLLMVSNMSLMGLPFLSGFYSKDILLEFAMSSSMGMLVAFFFGVGTVLTVLYTSRFMILSSGRSLCRPLLVQHVDSDWKMFQGFDGLFVLAIAGGSMLNHLYLHFSPYLMMSLELKNLTLSAIVLGLVFYHVKGGMTAPRVFKLMFSSLLSLTFLAKGFYKRGLFMTFAKYEKLIEKLWMKSTLFMFVGQFGLGPSVLDSRSLSVFWLVSGAMGGTLILV